MNNSNNLNQVSPKPRRNPLSGHQVLKTVGAIAEAARRLAQALRRTSTVAQQQRSNRAAAADHGWFQGISGAGTGWARTEYGEYYATSVSVYSAIKLRAEALGRPEVVVSRVSPQGVKLPVGPGHPAQQLLDRVNRWYTWGIYGGPPRFT